MEQLGFSQRRIGRNKTEAVGGGVKHTALIADAYRRNSNRPVAYLDESLRGPHEGGKPYYIVTAVVVPAIDRDALREGIENIVDGSYWHTSEEIRHPQGRERAEELLRFLAKGDEVLVISVNMNIPPVDVDLEGARRECLHRLLPALEAGAPTREPVRLALAEKRRDRSQQNRDARTHTELVRAKVISQHFRLLQTSPAEEHLLWLPDLVSSAVRQHVAYGQSNWLNIIKTQVEWVNK